MTMTYPTHLYNSREVKQNSWLSDSQKTSYVLWMDCKCQIYHQKTNYIYVANTNADIQYTNMIIYHMYCMLVSKVLYFQFHW